MDTVTVADLIEALEALDRGTVVAVECEHDSYTAHLVRDGSLGLVRTRKDEHGRRLAVIGTNADYVSIDNR